MSAFSAAASDEDGDEIKELRAENEQLRLALLIANDTLGRVARAGALHAQAAECLRETVIRWATRTEQAEEMLEAIGAGGVGKLEQPQSVTNCHQSQPQGEQPTMTPVAQRKLDDLLTRGYQISGYSVYHDTRHQHGFVTTAGLVGWWKPEGAEYPQPQGKAVGWLPLDCRGGYNFQQPQVEQEPVAWMWSSNDGTPSSVTFGGPNSNTPKDWIVQPLYTHPQNLNCKSTQARLATLWGYEKPQPKREPLTDDAATRLVQSVVAGSDRPIGMVAFGLLVARAIERAHGIGGEA